MLHYEIQKIITRTLYMVPFTILLTKLELAATILLFYAESRHCTGRNPAKIINRIHGLVNIILGSRLKHTLPAGARFRIELLICIGKCKPCNILKSPFVPIQY